MEVTITEAAANKIKEISIEYKIEPTVRIYIEKIAGKKAVYGIAFDEPKQYDILTEVDGIEVVTDTEYMTKYTDGINIDFTTEGKEGFVIISVKPPIKVRKFDDSSDEFVAEINRFDIPQKNLTRDKMEHCTGVGHGCTGCGCSNHS